MVATVANAAERMQKLLQQLRDGEGQADETVDLGAGELTRTVSSFRLQSPTLDLMLPDGPVTVTADSSKLRSAVGHLIQNALDAANLLASSSDCAPRVRVQLAERPPWAEVTVEDNGPGMAPQFVEQQLFQPFTSTKGVAGMGLGAYQARAYVRSLGGDVSVDSALTRFTIHHSPASESIDMINRRLLIIEDDPGLASQMRWCFDDVEVFTAGSAPEAEGLLRKEEPQVVTLDLGLPPDPGGTSVGFRLLETIGTLLPYTKVVVITGREEQENAVRAVAEGAYDFYQKPISSNTLNFVIDRAFKLWSLEAENRDLKSQTSSGPLDGMITACPQMLSLTRQIERVAPTDATVLILGETGTGKELAARAIHQLSASADGPFVAINCAAIPESLLESELFGHEKGAFTGAVGRKIGKIETANGGTLLLDEIGDMPLALQSKLLRFLQERTFERLGGTSRDPVERPGRLGHPP